SSDLLLPHHLRCSPQRFKRPRVRPPALDDFVVQFSIEEVGVVDVRDFQFPAGRRSQWPDAVKHGAVVEIHADDGVGRARQFGLFLNSYNSLPLKYWHTEALR